MHRRCSRSLFVISVSITIIEIITQNVYIINKTFILLNLLSLPPSFQQYCQMPIFKTLKTAMLTQF